MKQIHIALIKLKHKLSIFTIQSKHTLFATSKSTSMFFSLLRALCGSLFYEVSKIHDKNISEQFEIMKKASDAIGFLIRQLFLVTGIAVLLTQTVKYPILFLITLPSVAVLSVIWLAYTKHLYYFYFNLIFQLKSSKDYEALIEKSNSFILNLIFGGALIFTTVIPVVTLTLVFFLKSNDFGG